MFKAIINQQDSFEITEKGSGFVINNEELDSDIIKISDNYYHLLIGGKSYRAELSQVNEKEKSFVFKINGKVCEVQLKDRFDLLLEKLGMSNLNQQAVNDIKAPMPGLILDIKVEVGSEVDKGDQLLILEAMKMENVIKAAGKGVVKEIKVKKGDSVEKNQILIQF
jgi:biotin carboxyl carrier protein